MASCVCSSTLPRKVSSFAWFTRGRISSSPRSARSVSVGELPWTFPSASIDWIQRSGVRWHVSFSAFRLFFPCALCEVASGSSPSAPGVATSVCARFCASSISTSSPAVSCCASVVAVTGPSITTVREFFPNSRLFPRTATSRDVVPCDFAPATGVPVCKFNRASFTSRSTPSSEKYTAPSPSPLPSGNENFTGATVCAWPVARSKVTALVSTRTTLGALEDSCRARSAAAALCNSISTSPLH